MQQPNERIRTTFHGCRLQTCKAAYDQFNIDKLKWGNDSKSWLENKGVSLIISINIEWSSWLALMLANVFGLIWNENL